MQCRIICLNTELEEGGREYSTTKMIEGPVGFQSSCQQSLMREKKPKMEYACTHIVLISYWSLKYSSTVDMC